MTVATVADTTDEHDETFTVRLSSPANATLGDGTATGTIEDDDDPPAVNIANGSADEGEGIELTVSLDAASEKQVTVMWATSLDTGAAAAGAGDFTAVSATALTFAAGETEKTLTVATAEDTTDEYDETFTVRLSSPANATLGDGTATGTIVDDDDPPAVRIADAKEEEGDELGFAVSLTAASGKRVTVMWAASSSAGDTAESGTDFGAVSETVTFAPGETEKTLRVGTTEDRVDEADETLTVTLTLTLTAPPEATLEMDGGSATGTIRNDDPDPVVELLQDADSINENGGVSRVTARLDRPSGAVTTVAVRVAAEAPAESGDFTLSSVVTLTVPAYQSGSAGTGVVVTAVDNGTDAPDKTLTVSGTATNELGVTDPPDQTLTIKDDEPAPTPALQLVSSEIRESDDTALPGNQHETEVSVSLSHPSSAETLVTLGASDYYTASPTVLTVAAGATAGSGAATLTAVDNRTDAPDRAVNVSAAAANSQGIAGAPAAVELTITDDEEAPAVTLELSLDEIGEAGGRATVTARLSHPSSEATMVEVTADGTVERAAEHQITGPALTVPAGDEASDTAATVTAVDNGTDAPDQVVRVSATAVNSQGIAGVPAAVELTIEDDEEAPAVTLHLTPDTIAEENGVTVVTATQSHPSSEATVVTVSATAVTPAVTGDFTQSGSVLTVAFGETASTGTVTVTAVPNFVDADNKEVTVSATAANGQGIAGDPSSLTVTIEDDDVRGFVRDPEALTTRETTFAGEYTLALNSEPTADVRVTVTTTDSYRMWLLLDLFSPIDEKTFTFTPANWDEPQTVDVLPNVDTDAVTNTVVLDHEAVGGDYAGHSGKYTVTITDTDRVTENVELAVDPSRVAENGGRNGCGGDGEAWGSEPAHGDGGGGDGGSGDGAGGGVRGGAVNAHVDDSGGGWGGHGDSEADAGERRSGRG